MPINIDKTIEKKKRILNIWNKDIEIISKDYIDLKDYFLQDNCFAIFDPPYNKKTRYCGHYKEYTFFDFNNIVFNGIGFVLYGYDEKIVIQDQRYKEFQVFLKKKTINAASVLNEKMSIFIRKDFLD